MVLKFSGKEFLRITNFVFQLLMTKALSNDSIQRSIVSAAMSRENSTTGRMVENSIINILKKYPILLTIPTKQDVSSTFQIKNVKQFYHFNMQKNLFDRLGHLIPKQDQYSIGVPITSKDQKSSNSASIDLIFINRISQPKGKKKRNSKIEIQVYSYDLTVGKTKVLAQTQNGKLQKAQRLITEALSSYCYEDQKLFRIKKWNHIVLCPPQNFESIPTKQIITQLRELKNRTEYYYTAVSFFTESLFSLSLAKPNYFIPKEMDIQLEKQLSALKFFKQQIKY